MTTPEQNIAAVKELYLNLGPGIDHMMKFCRKHMTEDLVWMNLGFPTINGLEELERSLHMFKSVMNFDSNYVLDWRNLWGCDDKVFFERRGCFKDVNGEILIVWDVLGVYQFNEDGKIFAARDYYDNSVSYQMVADNFGEQALAAIRAGSIHPLAEDFDPADKPYEHFKL